MNLPIQKPLGFPIDSFLRRAKEVHESGWFSNHGPQVRELEGRLAQLLGVEEYSVVAVVNGTVGMQAFLSCSPVRFWSVPNYTFVATAHAALMSGKLVSLSDIPRVWPRIEAKASRWVNRGRIFVEPFGEPIVKMPEERDFKAANIFVDAAAGLANAIENGPFRYRGIATMFSLHATKVIGAGEGAILILPDEGLAELVRSWISFGFRGSRNSLFAGANGKMPELMAAGVNSILDEWPRIRDRWAELRAEVWNLEEQHGINHFHSVDSLSPYWIHEAKTAVDAELIRAELLKLRIETRLWWGNGLHTMPAFQSLRNRTWWRNYNSTSDVAPRVIGLPYFPGIEHRDVETIIRLLGAQRGS